MSDEHTSKFQCEYYTVYARPNSCFFCDNCNDIFYDYRNGYASPYMWLCDKGNDTELGMMGKCQDFYEEAEQTEPQTHDIRTNTHACVKDTHDKDEPNRSEKPNNYEPKICDTCRYYNSYIPCGSTPSACKEADKFAEEFVDGLKKLKLKTEPQTDTEIAKAIVHKMIDDAVIAEDAYPDLRQKMHDAVDEYEPQTDCPWK